MKKRERNDGKRRVPALVRTDPDFGLTTREIQVICDVAMGYSNREIAERLMVSEHTVKNHLSNIFDKLGVFNRVELALFATRNDLVA